MRNDPDIHNELLKENPFSEYTHVVDLESIGIANPSGCIYISRLHCKSHAQVVKLVNTRDLKSLDFGLAGSSPALGTILFN